MTDFFPLRFCSLTAVLALLGGILPARAEDRRDLSPEERATLAAAEREMRQQHEEAVKEALEAFKKSIRAAKSVGDRVKTVQALGAAERDAKIAAELGRLAGDAESVRIAAMEALATYRRDAAAAQALLRMLPLHARSGSMLAKNLEALGGVGHESVVPALARHVEEKEARVAVAAIRALGETGAVAAIPLLVEVWERMEKEKTRGDDPKRAAEERLKDVEPALQEALAVLTGKVSGTCPDYRSWWAENRATFRPKEEPPPPLCRHFLPIHVAGGIVTGGIRREVWAGVGGVHVNEAAALFGRPPSATAVLTRFEAPVNCGDDYAARIRGFLVPPVDGDYTFWISSDDASALFLSPNADPARKAWIAGVPDWSGVQEWTKHASQKSKPVPLVAGRKYYIEAQHKEGGGDKDHLVVAWEVPGGQREVIDGKHLAPPDGTEVARADAKAPPKPVEAGMIPGPGPAAGASPGAGRIGREVWWNVRGGLAEMRAGSRFATPPDRVTALDRFETPRDEADHFASRVRGFLLPPVSGDYRFWVASDNESELSLSPDEDPAKKRRLAGVPDFVSPLAWTEKPGQQSEGVPLVAGRRYYIEAVQAEGEGGDHLAVAWQLPGMSGPEVIPGRCLAPFAATAAAAAAPLVLGRPGSAFVRGVNLNGPAATIDGNAWASGGEAENCLVFGRPVRDDVTPLVPPDDAREPMLRTAFSPGGGHLRIVLAGVPSGRYRICLHVWENMDPVRFDVALAGRAVASGLSSGPAGAWQRLGPWPVEVSAGAAVVDCSGGPVKVCGIELWTE